jgi:alpha-galactosidase
LTVSATGPDIGQSQVGIEVLRADGFSVVIDTTTPSPTILHWGDDVGHDLTGVRAILEVAISHGTLDVVAPASITAEHGSGYPGRPGLEGFRPSGSGWAPRFRPRRVEKTAESLECVSIDGAEGLELRTTIRLEPSGLLRIRVAVQNTADTIYAVQALRVIVPLPTRASEALTFAGRWTNEYLPIRDSLHTGTLCVENRSGRTSHDRMPIAFVGTAAFGESSGEVWAAHLEWSGNSSLSIETAPTGQRTIAIEELLLPGEIVIQPGESYETPWVALAYSPHGTNGVSDAFHAELRSSSGHPSSPRPVLLNIWEAVYFDHNLETLKALADRSAEIGVERFVVDDGWFHGRRNDRAGLGDWWVDEAVWPEGLWPIVNHVVERGMEFGLWFEPEMVNPDSDLFRAHPEWLLTDQRYDPIFGRQQLVLDLGEPAVRAYLFDRISGLLGTYPIAYVKWDMNRVIVHGSHGGRAGVHEQTLGLYRLLDDLRETHPTVEFETCASGGGRIDLAMLRRTSRAWTSDCNDPLDRQRIQRGFTHLFPPEYMGAHIGGPVSHTTKRRHSLAFRAGTAFFGHLGIEWNVLNATTEDTAALANVIATHKRFRPLLHSGRSLRFDHPNPAVLAHGVVSNDQRESLISYALIATPESLVVEPLRLTGLDDDAQYRVELIDLVGPITGASRRQPEWTRDGATVSGRVLRTIGIRPPIIDAESMMLLHLSAV